MIELMNAPVIQTPAAYSNPNLNMSIKGNLNSKNLKYQRTLERKSGSFNSLYSLAIINGSREYSLLM